MPLAHLLRLVLSLEVEEVETVADEDEGGVGGGNGSGQGNATLKVVALDAGQGEDIPALDVADLISGQEQSLSIKDL